MSLFSAVVFDHDRLKRDEIPIAPRPWQRLAHQLQSHRPREGRRAKLRPAHQPKHDRHRRAALQPDLCRPGELHDRPFREHSQPQLLALQERPLRPARIGHLDGAVDDEPARPRGLHPFRDKHRILAVRGPCRHDDLLAIHPLPMPLLLRRRMEPHFPCKAFEAMDRERPAEGRSPMDLPDVVEAVRHDPHPRLHRHGHRDRLFMGERAAGACRPGKHKRREARGCAGVGATGKLHRTFGGPSSDRPLGCRHAVGQPAETDADCPSEAASAHDRDRELGRPPERHSQLRGKHRPRLKRFRVWLDHEPPGGGAEFGRAERSPADDDPVRPGRGNGQRCHRIDRSGAIVGKQKLAAIGGEDGEIEIERVARGGALGRHAPASRREIDDHAPRALVAC